MGNYRLTYKCESAFSALYAYLPSSLKSKPVKCDSRYEGCVVQNETKLSWTDSKEGSARVTL